MNFKIPLHHFRYFTNNAEATMLDIDHLNSSQGPLRIAVVSETWPPEINGVAITMHRLALELAKRGHSIQVIRPRQNRGAADHADTQGVSATFDETLTYGLPIPAYPHLRMGLPAKRLLGNIWKRQRPDLVHVATEGPLGWSAIRAAKKLKIPVSSDFRTNFHSYGQHYGIGRLKKAIATYLRKFHNLTDFTTVPTERLRSELQGLGFERLQVVSRGIDTSRFSPMHRSDELRRQWGVTPCTRVFLYVGRLAPEKNPSLLAQTWRTIAARDGQVKLVIVGEGPSEALYRKLMPDAIYAGAQIGHNLAVHYASSDIFLFPSVTETYGNVVPEAMASGLMGLTFNYASSSDLVQHGHNGWVANYADEAQYLEMAAELAGLPNTDLAFMREQASTTMKARGWDVISGQVETLWREQLVPQLNWSSSGERLRVAVP